MRNRHINKVAVLGSGVMGSRIACHFANVGVEVLLLDIAPRELSPAEEKAKLSLDNPAVRNRIVNEALQNTLRSNPSPIYLKQFANRITTGNFEDDMSKISGCDWIIEVVVERLDIKKQVFEKVEKFRTPGTIVSSNTSGIPLASMAEGRSEDFKKHFCGTHFFNPPRYLRLLEIIPTSQTDPAVVDFLLEYGSRYLGKETVLARDTPAFIANRIGVYSMMEILHLIGKSEYSVEDIDKLTGPVIGHPKSATFRTADVVGLDTLALVAKGVADNCPEDERSSVFAIPGFVEQMIQNKWLGSKTGSGFYKKTKTESGESQILSLDLKSLEYTPQQKSKFPALDLAKAVEDVSKRLHQLFQAKSSEGDFYRTIFTGLFSYSANRIPEISDQLYKIDNALRAGFGWELGPFQKWDAVGFKNGLEQMKAQGLEVAPWVAKMADAGFESFYTIRNGRRYYYDIEKEDYAEVPVLGDRIFLQNIIGENIIWQNSGTTIKNLGDGILNVEFHTKMNTIGGDVIAGLNKAIDLAEAEYKGLVISNNGANFSAGANVGMIFMMAVEQDFDELNLAVKTFQNTMMRLRYSAIPVVAAPHNMALGGGCELSMHCDKVVAHAELYMGLVEFGVGVIPGGGGTKEFALRAGDEMNAGDIRTNTFRNRFLTIGQAKVSTSAHEAFELGYLRPGVDEIVINRDDQLIYAKKAALQLAAKGYTKPIPRKDVYVLGNEALGLVYVGAHSMKSGHYISDHDQLISEKLGFVLAGGDLSEPQHVSEQYLLDLERKAFVELCGQRKTLERLQSMVQKGKILRN